ncbi:unnamed protein product [Thelazia callipaeda]|uniref:Protein kinase domain-containing protein n=1 Tax=Thelazia callipaeda TaxID=103827 RepID=A0A158RBZ1_THECL|nr:unnamed protein product [Thelazia callipaeda]
MVIFTALPPGTSNQEGRILVDESDYRNENDEVPPFQIKDIVQIRSNEQFTKHYECMDEIGEGKFGKVYRCREKTTGLELAAKRIKIKRETDWEKVEREVAIMTKLRHPRIAQIYDAVTTFDNDIVLIMEIVINVHKFRVNGGELFDRVVDENYILTELGVVMIVCQLCEAVSYIHSKSIVHLDIKPENIMCVSQTGNRIKLIDFGLAQFYDNSSNLLFMAGTPEFVAPEVIKFEPIDFHTDMWSIGVLTYILLSGISPFLGETLGDTYVAVEKGEWEFDDEAFEGISDAAKDFISKLLITNQKQRMLPEDCLKHPWIVSSRTKAANDLMQSQMNSRSPMSKEELKCYIKNRRLRKATWALVFLIRFKRQSQMKSRRRELLTADVAEINTAHLATKRATKESFTKSKNKSESMKSNEKDEQVPDNIVEKSSDPFSTELTAVKHSKGTKSSSEIPRKKSKASVLEEGKAKKKAKKHKEGGEKSDMTPSKPKKISKHLKTTHHELEEKPLESDSAQDALEMCELCVNLETSKPAVSYTEFTKLTCASESTQSTSPIYEVERTSKSETKLAVKTKNDIISVNQKSQEAKNKGYTMYTPSEINKKASSVAAILSMFSEKAEREKMGFEHRPSRPVRTFRDVQKNTSNKPLVATINKNDVSGIKVYRAPEKDKERVKNLIELHRRGSKDRKQVDSLEIVAVKNDENMKKPREENGKIKVAQELLATNNTTSTKESTEVKVIATEAISQQNTTTQNACNLRSVRKKANQHEFSMKKEHVEKNQSSEGSASEKLMIEASICKKEGNKVTKPEGFEKLISHNNSKKYEEKCAEKINHNAASINSEKSLSNSITISQKMKLIERQGKQIRNFPSVYDHKTDTNKPNDDANLTLTMLERSTSKKPPKTPGSSRHKRRNNDKINTRMKNESEHMSSIVCSSASKDAAVSVHEKASDFLQILSPTVQNNMAKVQISNNTITPLSNIEKDEISQSSIRSKNPLMKIKSEVNLAEFAKEASSHSSRAVHLRRHALVDQSSSLVAQTQQFKHNIMKMSLTNQENFSFGWLKFQLEDRVNKEKENQTTWKPRRDLRISPAQSGNAKKALDIWKAMERNCLSKS